MIRDQKLPAGPRPVASRSPTRPAPENVPPGSSTSRDPMLHASSSNNHSLFSFGRNGSTTSVAEPNQSALDFLPSVSFDDLQSSLESASNEFKLTEFPAPPTAQQGGSEDISSNSDRMAGQQSDVSYSGGGGPRASFQSRAAPTAPTAPVAPVGPAAPVAPVAPVRPSRASSISSRAGSILRRPSTSSRQVSMSSNASATSGTMEPPTAPAAMRNRRQSHYPPVSNTNIGFSKPPRKSIGPGVIDSDYNTRLAQRRRPSVASNASDNNARSSLDISNGQAGDGTRNFSSSRTTKARSIQPPPRVSGNLVSSNSNNSLTADAASHRISSVFPRSPRTGGKGNTPNSNRRMSVMPGQGNGNFATGLGARTISPTDAQRMRRLSAHPSQSLTQIANAPAPAATPPSVDTPPPSNSPSLIPRKTSTPSSLRTTPEVTNRKSFSSGLSVASNTSFNTHRTSTGSITRNVSQGQSSSRLPAPKPLVTQNPPPAEEEEDVPPVPAIPKAYESPKDASAEASFLEKRKSAYPLETSSIHSNSTSNLSSTPVLEPANTIQRKSSARKIAPRKSMAAPASEAEHQVSTKQSKKSLQPLSLPPIHLGPLSTPTASKISSFNPEMTPQPGTKTPPARVLPKTPTTPMTASKSSFFSRARSTREPEKPVPRSSSVNNNADSPFVTEPASSSDSLEDESAPEGPPKSSVSPFLSSSAPKGGDSFESYLVKSKTTSEVNKTIAIDTTSSESRPQQKPTGPRAPKLAKPAAKSPEPSPEEQPSTPATPGSMSSLRRKLSLSWKRSNSKGSNHLPTASVDKTNGQQARQESMPPPRLPVSATMNLNSMKAPSPSNTNKQSHYLESRRRKSSSSSLSTALMKDKSRTDTWPNPKKDVGNSSMIETTTQPGSSTVQRVLRPRPSAASVRSYEIYTASELDKDDHTAEDEMKKLGSRKKETEIAARTLDALRKRATPKERVGPQEAIRIAMLNIYERGEIVDYNDIYFCGTQNASKVVGDVNSSAPNFGYDDDRGDYSIVIGDHLSYRYEVVDVLGKGSFGQVVRCIDHKTGALVAVKIIRNKKRFHQQALVEVNILQKLREWDPKNKHSMVNFTHSFYFRGHLCISTELLDMNLYEFIKSNSFRGFSVKLIRRFTKQMLSSLNLLKQRKVIHCDLKPENILLRHPMHSEIKVIDFGSSCFENEKVYTYIQSRFYRSPEVILGMTYGLPIDMWSLGCILAELFTGVPIFPGENEQEQLACIMEIFGPPEKHLIEKSTRKKLFFDSMGKPRLTVSSKGRRRRPSSKTLQQAIKCDDEAFLDFLARCLRWDPDRRMKPEEAVRHEFITGQKTSMPIPRARENSPMKRHNTISNPRPLPDPPTLKASATLRPRDTSAVSPHKPVSSVRRASGINGPATAGTKRTSTGNIALASANSGSTSSLPRVAGRTASGKQDLASAGANVAMSRRV